MRSLRARLLLYLCIAVIVVGIVSVAIAYRQANLAAKQVMDTQLEQIARILASQPGGLDNSGRTNDEDIQVAVWSPDGKLQYASTPDMADLHTSRSGFTEVTLDGQLYRLYTSIAPQHHIEIAQPMDARDDLAEAAALSALLPVVVLLPVLAFVIAFVVRALLQPVRDIAHTVARRETLDRKALDVKGLPAEVVPLIEEINQLLERQGEAVERERQFVADAAHALRTPLAALQLQADVLDGSSDPVERAKRLTELRSGIQRATRLAEELLTLARSESGVDASTAVVDLDAVLREVQALYQPLADAGSIAIRIDAQSAAQVRGDARLLMLICGNLLDNALRYTPTGHRVEIGAHAERDQVRIEIRDEGPGLPEVEISRVFERFYRAAGDRSTGSGLGLATVASLVKQLGGEVGLHNRTDRSGLVARVTLPRVQIATSHA